MLQPVRQPSWSGAVSLLQDVFHCFEVARIPAGPLLQAPDEGRFCVHGSGWLESLDDAIPRPSVPLQCRDGEDQPVAQ